MRASSRVRHAPRVYATRDAQKRRGIDAICRRAHLRYVCAFYDARCVYMRKRAISLIYASRAGLRPCVMSLRCASEARAGMARQNARMPAYACATLRACAAGVRSCLHGGSAYR